MANNVHAEAPATVRVIELVGVSDKSWSDAAQQAVERASETIRHVTGIDVLHSTGVVRGGKIVEYHVNLKVAFVVDREDLHFSPEGQ
jgi:flavin-binding protein dodecin